MRHGVTIMEVLFAIMVTSVGVLAALTLLPVAGTVALKARTADAATTAVTAAVADFDAKGMRIPTRWMGWNADWDMRPSPPKPALGYYHLSTMNLRYGMSVCIDPRGIAANDINNETRQEMSTFPYTPVTAFPYDPLMGPPRMFRVTLDNGQGFAMNKLMAESLFTFNDDLNYDRLVANPFSPLAGPRVEDGSVVASQIFDALPAGASPARRRTEGKLSWMATLVPKVERYAPIPTNEFVLSIVVFHDRPANLGRDPNATVTPRLLDPMNERVLTVAQMPSSGITGGEVLLTWTPTPPSPRPPNAEELAEEQLDIHPNEWIMLSGRIPVGFDVNPGLVGVQPGFMNVFKWYRVSDLEEEMTDNGTSFERWITLIGSDWNVPVTNTEAVAVEGVVAVMERTIRLEY